MRLITATASTATGQALMRTAAEDLKKVRWSWAATRRSSCSATPTSRRPPAPRRRSFSNMGQICIAVNRILVDERVREPFVEALAAAVGEMTIGHGVDDGISTAPARPTPSALAPRSTSPTPSTAARAW